ncbi:YadA-like family protein [Salmonella enterica]|nr:YadA-like family protein [Salmonella enterica]EHU5767752.1 YadA-like family protein [Salmonella enterica]
MNNANNEALNAYNNLNARDRMMADALYTKLPQETRVQAAAGIIDQAHPVANIPEGWHEEKTLAQIAQMRGETPAPAPVAPVRESAQMQSIRANLEAAKAEYVKAQDPAIRAALRDTMTDLRNQLTLTPQGIQLEVQEAKDQAKAIEQANTKAGFAAAQAKPATYDAPAGVEAVDRANSMAQAAAVTPATYDAPAGAEAKAVAESKAFEVKAAEIQAANDTKAANAETRSNYDAEPYQQQLDTQNAKNAEKVTAAEPVKAPVVTRTKEEAPASTQVVNHYTISGMTAKQAAQQQDNTDQIIVHSRAISTNAAGIAANRDAINSLESSTNKRFADIDKRVSDNKKQAAAGTSSAMAMANIPQVTESQTFAIGAGVGGYDSQNAIAVGASFRASQNVVIKATISDDSASNFGYGAGVSVGW